jgi:hypothetical protein
MAAIVIINQETLRLLQNNQGFSASDDDVIHRSPSIGKIGSNSLLSSEWLQDRFGIRYSGHEEYGDCCQNYSARRSSR